eukprot:4872465-Alexandrium_andersonii.AAC.1
MTHRSRVSRRSRLVPFIVLGRSVGLCGASQSRNTSSWSWATLRSCRLCPSTAAAMLQPSFQSADM